MDPAPSNPQDRWRPAKISHTPQLRVKDGGRTCTVSCWHLTPARLRISWFFSRWSARILAAAPAWFCWNFRHIPEPLRRAVEFCSASIGHPSITGPERNCVYAGLWAASWLLCPLWARAFGLLYRAALLKRTAVRFTAGDVSLRCPGRPGRRFARTPAAPITFLLGGYPPNAAWLEAKARRRGAEDLVLLYQQSRVVLMQYGWALVPVAPFTNPEEAERFSKACQFANAYPLQRAAPPPSTRTRWENDSDV